MLHLNMPTFCSWMLFISIFFIPRIHSLFANFAIQLTPTLHPSKFFFFRLNTQHELIVSSKFEIGLFAQIAKITLFPIGFDQSEAFIF